MSKLTSGSAIVIATHNEGKLREIAPLFSPLGIQTSSAAQYNVPEPEETGETFKENAELKARHCAQITHMPSLADDSGLVVPLLNGQPGVHSARWAGPQKDFVKAMNRIYDEIESRDQDPDGTKAYFVCHLCLAWPMGQTAHAEGRIYGTLSFPPKGTNGFGYDPIFIPDGKVDTFGEMDPAEKDRISHRALAFEQFVANHVLVRG